MYLWKERDKMNSGVKRGIPKAAIPNLQTLHALL
jgi:hypothetical protein